MSKSKNVRLIEGQEPITVSGRAYGEKGVIMAFPVLQRQKNGWHSKNPGQIVKQFGDRYELINEDGKNLGGGN